MGTPDAPGTSAKARRQARKRAAAQAEEQEEARELALEKPEQQPAIRRRRKINDPTVMKRMLARVPTTTIDGRARRSNLAEPRFYAGADSALRQTLDQAILDSIGDVKSQLALQERKILDLSNWNKDDQQTRLVSEFSPKLALKEALISAGKLTGSEAETRAANSLGQNELWKDMKTLKYSTLEKMAAGKVLATFVEDPDITAEMLEAYPDFDPRYPTIEQKQLILQAFILDLWGSGYLTKAWNGIKKLGKNAVSAVWDHFKNSPTFRDAKKLLDDLADGVKSGSPSKILAAIKEGANLATDLATTNPLAVLKDAGRAALEGAVGGDEDMQLASGDTVEKGGRMASGLAPATYQSAGKPAFVQQPTLVTMRSRFHYDAVNLSAVAGWICPEDYPSRMPVDMTQRTAVASSIWTQGITTNSAGACGIYVYPWCLTNGLHSFNGQFPTAQSTFPFCSVYSSSAFLPSTGVFGTVANDWTDYIGPLQPVSSQIQAFRVNSASIRITTTPSYNSSQGMVQLAYFTDFPNSTWTNVTTTLAPAIPQNNLSNMTNYQMFNLKASDAREVSVLDGPADLTMAELSQGSNIGNTQGSEGWYILVTGAPASTQVLALTVSYVVEYLPTTASLPLLNLLYSDPGPATISLVSNLIKAAPQLLRLSLEHARSLSAAIYQLDSHRHDDVMNFILDRLDNMPIPAINSKPFVSAAPYFVGGDDEDSFP